MIVNAKVRVTINTEALELNDRDLNEAVASHLMIDREEVEIKDWIFDGQQELSDSQKVGTAINEMWVNGEGPAYGNPTPHA